MTSARSERAPIQPGAPPMSDAEFALLRDVIQREAGIYLGPSKKALLAARLARRMRELGLGTHRAYYRHLVETGADEMVRLLDLVSTNETHFFREARHFDLLESRILPEWEAGVAAGARPARVRVWSAGCSTGEEPYSLAMLLLERLPPERGWVIEILATDLSTRALGRAEAGEWPLDKRREIPARHLKAFMLRGTGTRAGVMRAGQALRSVVQFRRVNLHLADYGAIGVFDAVFCRNVLIYFGQEARRAVIHRLLDHLAYDGYLFLGHSESLHGVTDRARAVVPTVYEHADRLRGR